MRKQRRIVRGGVKRRLSSGKDARFPQVISDSEDEGTVVVEGMHTVEEVEDASVERLRKRVRAIKQIYDGLGTVLDGVEQILKEDVLLGLSRSK